MSLSGIPHSPKPPTASVLPLTMSAIASPTVVLTCVAMTPPPRLRSFNERESYWVVSLLICTSCRNLLSGYRAYCSTDDLGGHNAFIV
jgi:hypothetical protein